MSRLGFKSVTVYDVDTFLGELIVVPVSKDANSNFIFPNNEIRITHISPPSERSRPLSVLQTISSYSVRCKLESNLPSDQQTKLLSLHASCFYELKTAVVVLGGEEIHLVAMPSKQKNFPCFWCCSVPAGLYNSCLAMLNLRCLSIVFDLDETLIVANTMKSFEDKIDKLKGWIAREPDPDRASGMTAELKRYTDDRELLKQYAEYDSVTDGGMIYKVQLEEVPRSSDNEEKVVRPIIRLPDKNIVLTRINPKNRDTSVLVRLRPAWEELRCYLTAKGRKRFEVFVCTMAVRDYALEMWRLLDPEAHLISLKQQGARVVCVKSGSRKSLLNVFQDGICHPNLAMVIDDRLEVWEDKDQSRVHVVPPYTPYYAPQAETAHPVPLLCVARNVACNVRGGFFKEFDENMYRRICDLFYEDDISSLPPPTDVSTFLMIEDTCFIPNGNTNIPIPEGMRGAEVEQRLCHEDEKAVDSSSNPVANVPQMKPEIADQPAVSAPSVVNPQYSMETTPKPKPSLLGVQARRENFSSESDLEKKRRSLTVQHGINMRTPAFGDPPILKSSAQPSSVPSQSQGGWSEEDVMKGHLNHQTSQVPQPYPIAVGQTGMSASQVLDVYRGRGQEVGIRHEQKKQNTTSKQMPVGRTSEVAVSQNHISSTSEDFQTEDPNANASNANLSISALQEIGRRCNSKVEFKYIGIARRDFQFSVEVLFTGEKIGIGMGKTRKDAEQQAAQNALRGLADQYLACVGHASGADNRNFNKLSKRKENGFIWDNVNS